MHPEQYKKIKVALGANNINIFLSYFHISKDSDKAYSSGRSKIPDLLGITMEQELKQFQSKVTKLKLALQACFSESSVNINNDTNDITVVTKNNQVITFKNEGRDWLGFNIYRFLGPKKLKKTIIYFPKKDWEAQREDKDFDWVFWIMSINRNTSSPYQELSSELLLKEISG
jgi:hypothetical protein